MPYIVSIRCFFLQLGIDFTRLKSRKFFAHGAPDGSPLEKGMIDESILLSAAHSHVL